MTKQQLRDNVEDVLLIPYRWWHTSGRFALDLTHYYQRARRGYSYRDCWNLDSYLAEVIVGGVGELRTKSHGYPGNLGSMEEWDAILAKIQEGFALLCGEEKWRCRDDVERREDQKKIDRAKALLMRYFENLWD